MAEEAERKNRLKYFHLSHTHLFTPVAIETLGVFGPSTCTSIRELGLRLIEATLEPLAHHHLIQRLVVAVQQGNTAAILGTTNSTPPDTSFFH